MRGQNESLAVLAEYITKEYSKMQPMIRMGTKFKGHKICDLHGSYGL